jgi:RNA polymerase sigma-70 factor (ECF subfamily)
MTSEQEQTAARLMTLVHEGDSAAYNGLLTLLSEVARRFARHRAGDVPWLDDVVQETLVTVHRVRHTYDTARPFAPWFYAILSSRLVDVVRKERRIGSREIGTDILPEYPALERDTEADRSGVVAAVERLPERQREIVKSLKIRDESVKAVGERLGMNESAVRVAAHRGYRALRKLLRGERRED